MRYRLPALVLCCLWCFFGCSDSPGEPQPQSPDYPVYNGTNGMVVDGGAYTADTIVFDDATATVLLHTTEQFEFTQITVECFAEHQNLPARLLLAASGQGKTGEYRTPVDALGLLTIGGATYQMDRGTIVLTEIGAFGGRVRGSLAGTWIPNDDKAPVVVLRTGARFDAVRLR